MRNSGQCLVKCRNFVASRFTDQLGHEIDFQQPSWNVFSKNRINQSINQSMDQSMDQSINQLIEYIHRILFLVDMWASRTIQTSKLQSKMVYWSFQTHLLGPLCSSTGRSIPWTGPTWSAPTCRMHEWHAPESFPPTLWPGRLNRSPAWRTSHRSTDERAVPASRPGCRMTATRDHWWGL